jgi:hypothetical protein
MVVVALICGLLGAVALGALADARRASRARPALGKERSGAQALGR